MGRRLQPAPKILSRDAQAFAAAYSDSATFRLPAMDLVAMQPSVPMYVQFGIEYATGQIDWEQSDETSVSPGAFTNWGSDGELAAFNIMRVRGVSGSGTVDLRLNYKGR